MGNTQVDNVNHQPAARPGDIFEAVHRLMHLFRAEQYRILQDTLGELSHLEGKTLGFIVRHPGTTLTGIVAHQGRDKGQVARLLKILKQKNLVREEADEKDRRSVRLHPTPAGVEVNDILARRVKSLSRLAVKNLSAAERSQLLGLLTRLERNLKPA